ncbi:MAG: DUF2807 domain-containing protein [Saprospiraceae bacterium]|nr:DUF2807 domain-containing protein [Saprospiraceae bacterium]
MRNANFKWLAVMMVISMSISSCFIDVNDDDGFFGCVDGDGPIVEQTLNLDDFSGIELSLPIEVILTQGDVQQVVVQGKQNIIDELERDVRNGVWDIETRDCVRDIGNMKIFITIPEIDELSIAGSGEIFGDNIFIVNDVELEISGSGNMDLAMEGDDFQATITGSGNIKMEGVADELDLKITGSGDIAAFDMDALRARVEITGSGNAEVRVQDELDVKISGSGDVRYKGTPSLDVSISGSGRVVDAN